MAVQLNGSTQYLQASSPTVSTHPMSWSGWFYFDDVTRNDTCLVIRNNSSFEGWDLRKETAGKAAAVSFNGSNKTALGTTTLVSGTWYHLGCVFASTTSRKIYVNGTLEATETTAAAFGATPDRFAIGSFIGGGLPLKGRAAQIGVYNIGLSDANMVSLAGGSLPSAVAAANLQNYYKLVADGTDEQGNLSMTLNGSPTFVSDPQIFLSGSSGTIPAIMASLRQRRVPCLF